jgi:hypothetical protein
MKIGVSNPGAQVIKTLIATILGSDGNALKAIGYLPKGATVIKREAIVNSAFDGTLDVGVVNIDDQRKEIAGTGDPDALIDTDDITENTVGSYSVFGHVACSPTYATVVTALITMATGGSITVRIDYVEAE